jgi:ankyrin repeat protein
MFAAYFGHSEVVNLLVEKGAAVDAKDSGGNGPIDWAAVGGHKDIAKQFADRGARLNPPKGGGAFGAFLSVGSMPMWFMDQAAKNSA